MATTVEQVRRQLRARCPLAPPLFVDSLVQEAYNKICERRPWSWLRGQGQIAVTPQTTGACAVTHGSKLVTGAGGPGLTFTSLHVGRQFKVGSMLPLTILSVDTGANTATLDDFWPGATAAAASGIVLDAYATLPENFGKFIAVLDPPNSRQLRLWITEDELNYYDPQRSLSGQAGAVVSRRLSSLAATTGQVQYELVPYQTTAQRFPYFCINRPGELGLDDTFLGPLRHRTDIVMTRALLEIALWPGLSEKPNPYFRMELADRLEKQYLGEVALLECKDEEIYSTWLETIGINQIPFASFPFAPSDYRSSDWAPREMIWP